MNANRAGRIAAECRRQFALLRREPPAGFSPEEYASLVATPLWRLLLVTVRHHGPWPSLWKVVRAKWRWRRVR